MAEGDLRIPPQPPSSEAALKKALEMGIPPTQWIRDIPHDWTEWMDAEDVKFSHGGSSPRQMHEFPPELQNPKLSGGKATPPR